MIDTAELRRRVDALDARLTVFASLAGPLAPQVQALVRELRAVHQSFIDAIEDIASWHQN